MKRSIPKIQLVFSRNLRKNQTPWETKLWQYLRAHRFYNLKFKRQVQIGKFIVDFCCYEKKLVIELDGSGHNLSKGKLKDKVRSSFLEKEGYRALHVWNNELDENIDGVLEKIRKVAFEDNPSGLRPSPLKRRE